MLHDMIQNALSCDFVKAPNGRKLTDYFFFAIIRLKLLFAKNIWTSEKEYFFSIKEPNSETQKDFY